MTELSWLLLGIVSLVLLGLSRFLRTRTSARVSYVRQDFLLSAEERHLYKALRQAIGEDYAIFGRIRVEDIITPRSAAGMHPAWDALEHLGETHFSFVLCKLPDLSIACAIQLIQPRGQGRKSAESVEQPLRSVCSAAGLPLVRLEASPFYDRLDIRQAVADATRREPLFIHPGDRRKEPTIAELENLEL